MSNVLEFTMVERPSGSLAAISMCPVVGGFVEVAWDTCAGCGQHLNNCNHDIPVEPDYIRRWRQGESYTVLSPEVGYGFSKNVGASASPAKPKAINVLDLVDDEMLAKIKEEKESRD